MAMDTALQELQPWIAANETVEQWAAGARAFALLRGALSAGILDAAQRARTPAALAAITGIATDWMADICAALTAHGVFDMVDDCFRVSGAFATLLAPDVFQTLSAMIDLRMVEVRTLESVAAPPRPYTALATEDLLAVAEGVTARPAARLFRAFIGGWTAACLPEVHALLAGGGRWAEFGCGIGGGLLAYLLTYPTCTAVGMEINAQVIKETRRRAVEAGVTDRVELRHIDVRDVRDEAVFDAGFWSQGFFPEASRAAALAAIARSLKPGGYLMVPGFEGGEPPAEGAEPRGPENRGFTLSRVVYRRWGIPTPAAQELRAELESAGLEFVRCVPLWSWQYLLMRRPCA